MTEIQQLIIQTRQRMNLSQEKFGSELGVKRQSVSLWELGLSKPKMDRLLKLQKVSGWQRNFAEQCISLMLEL